MNKFEISAIGYVRGGRADIRDDFWGGAEARIELAPGVPDESLLGLESFSHVEVFFVFDRDPAGGPIEWSRHPRGDVRWPRVGIFAQRARRRPNRLGATIVRLASREARAITVIGLDAADGTPVVDLKPVFSEFLPREPVGQPTWVSELMADYWKVG
jgi:tRNA (adenine37-N6)-methyltransferase